MIHTSDKRLQLTINIFMILMVMTSIWLTIFESFDQLMTPMLRDLFLSIHTTILMTFLVEFGYRLWHAPQMNHDLKPWVARWQFLINPLTIIDIIVLAPLFVILWTHDLHDADLVILRLLRFTSMFTMFRFYRSSRIVQLFRNLSHQVWYDILIVCIVTLQCIVITWVIFYNIEHTVNPRLTSVFDGVYWSVMTLTTIGYGDVAPVTVLGKLLAMMLGLIGIGLMALPTGILASGFMRALRHEKKILHIAEEIEEDEEDIEERVRKIEKSLRSNDE